MKHAGYRERDTGSLPFFMQYLATMNQASKDQIQAAESIRLYYELIEDHMQKKSSEGKMSAEEAWEQVYITLKEEVNLRHYSHRTLKTYAGWIQRFDRYVKCSPELVGSIEVKRFLTHLAVERGVSASTQNQAFNAILFLFRHVLRKDFDVRTGVVRARKKRYIPSVLNREEFDRILTELTYPYTLVVQMLYGCGLRLFECLNLRVQCFDFDQNILIIHDGKGRKDRSVPLPVSLVPDLRGHMTRVKNLHSRDVENGYDGVFLPRGAGKKSTHAAKEYMWQWFFPAKTLTYVPDNGKHLRYHLHESSTQKAIRTAVRKAQLCKRATAHTFRHSFASHLLQANYDIRTIQQMLGHSDIRTTMIYTHTTKSRTLKEQRSPLDFTGAPDSV